MNTGSLLMMLGMVLLGVVGRIMKSQALDGAVYWSGLTIFIFSVSFICRMIAKNIRMPNRMRRFQTIISKRNNEEVMDDRVRFCCAHGSAKLIYNFDVVRLFVIASAFWGIAAFAVLVYIVLQLADLVLNLNLPWPLFGR